MSDTERSTMIEDRLPSVEAIKEEYAKQGRALSDEEAELIREQMREDVENDHFAADGTCMDDDDAEGVTGGAGGAPRPTCSSVGKLKPSTIKYEYR